MLTKNDLAAFDLVLDEIPVARLTFGISLYMSAPLTTIKAEVVEAYNRFLALVGPKGVCQYATETMKRHKPLTPRALSMVPTWFGPKAPVTESYGIELTDAVPFNAAATAKFHLTGCELTDAGRVESATLVRYVLPASWALERPKELRDIAKGLCALLPFRSGAAGFGFEYSKYFTATAVEHAWSKSMRHPGIDIHDNVNDPGAVAFDGIRGVGWLTMIDDAFVEELGGAPALKECTATPVNGGILIQAGAAPAIGDVNRHLDLPAYREAFRYVQPVTVRTFERASWLGLARDEGPRTERWLKRFANG